jgi:hypothetical protein
VGKYLSTFTTVSTLSSSCQYNNASSPTDITTPQQGHRGSYRKESRETCEFGPISSGIRGAFLSGCEKTDDSKRHSEGWTLMTVHPMPGQPNVSIRNSFTGVFRSTGFPELFEISGILA